MTLFKIIYDGKGNNARLALLKIIIEDVTSNIALEIS